MMSLPHKLKKIAASKCAHAKSCPLSAQQKLRQAIHKHTNNKYFLRPPNILAICKRNENLKNLILQLQTLKLENSNHPS